MAIWHPAIKAYRDAVARHRVVKEEKRLAATDELVFSRDHVGFKSEIWERQLSGLANRNGLEMLEIGSYEGRSAIWFMQHVLTGSNCRLTCVDPWHPITKLRFDHNIRIAGVANRVRAIQKGSQYALTEDLVDETFDLIYVDGSHRAPEVLFDAVFAWPHLVRGGILFFDDYEWRPDLPPGDRPKPSIDRFMQVFEDEIDIVEIGFQVLLRKRA